MKTSHLKFNTDETGTWPSNTLVAAVDALKVRLQARYERFLPGETALINKAFEEAESIAWSTTFPHLFLPDLVEEEISRVVATACGSDAEACFYAHAA